MNNTFVFLASFSSAALAMWLIAALPHKIDNWLRVRRRVRESVHPPKVRTTIHTAPSTNPAAKPAVMIITDFPLISHDHPYVARLK